jgi:hypothetical protein
VFPRLSNISTQSFRQMVSVLVVMMKTQHTDAGLAGRIRPSLLSCFPVDTYLCILLYTSFYLHYFPFLPSLLPFCGPPFLPTSRFYHPFFLSVALPSFQPADFKNSQRCLSRHVSPNYAELNTPYCVVECRFFQSCLPVVLRLIFFQFLLSSNINCPSPYLLSVSSVQQH